MHRTVLTPGGKNFGQTLQTLEKNEDFGSDVHDPKRRTSMNPGRFENLRSEKLQPEFRSLNWGPNQFKNHMTFSDDFGHFLWRLHRECPKHKFLESRRS